MNYYIRFSTIKKICGKEILTSYEINQILQVQEIDKFYSHILNSDHKQDF